MFKPLIHIQPSLEILPPIPSISKNLTLKGELLESVWAITPAFDSKNLIIFIGGFLDSYYRIVFEEYAHFVEDNLFQTTFGAKIYTTFNCKDLFCAWLPALIESHYKPYIIAHSWGAKNICRALETICLPDLSIPYLLTLDPVGYYKPQKSFDCIKQWVNVYVKDKKQYPLRTNYCTYIGRAWDYTPAAHLNISIDNQNLPFLNTSSEEPAIITHVDVNFMLETFRIYTQNK